MGTDVAQQLFLITLENEKNVGKRGLAWVVCSSARTGGQILMV